MTLKNLKKIFRRAARALTRFARQLTRRAQQQPASNGFAVTSEGLHISLHESFNLEF